MNHCHPGEGRDRQKAYRWLIIRMIVAAICCIPLLLHMFGLHIPLAIQGVLATIVQFFSGWPFYVGTGIGLKKFSANMDTLVALGTTAAYLFSFYIIFSNGSRGIYFETSTLIITFILIGRVLEERSKRQAESGMHALLAMQPEYARVSRRGEFVKVPPEEVQVGDVFMVQPGEKIPADGKIEKGESVVDESMLTGESITVEKGVGSPIFAGTINHHGMFIGMATKKGTDTALHHIIRLVQNAQQSKAPIQRLADKTSGVFVPIVLIIALFTWFIWSFIAHEPAEGIINAVSVLVIACPCALGLATPIVILVACSTAASKGIFIKNAEALETAQKIKRVVIDKTNTVTEGTLTVEKALLPESYYPIVKTLCEHSEHPASKGILEFLKQKGVVSVPTMLAFRPVAGRGVSGYFDDRKYFLGSVAFLEEQRTPTQNFQKPLEEEIGMLVALGTEKLGLGYFILSDHIKPGSKVAVDTLKKMGIETILLSGDRKKEAERVATELNFDSFEAEVLPADKVKYIEMAKREGKIVAMVGDGVNDAPALAAADVGFAIGSGTDIAMESASVGLMRSHLIGVIDTITLSKQAYKKIVQNLVFAFGYNILAIPLAALGLVNPIIAAVAMALSSISVVFNALLLNKKLPK